MITSPTILALTLVGLVTFIVWAEKSGRFPKLFHYLPSAFWCYMTPMLLSTAGLLPPKSVVYDFLTSYVLAACLLLLLLSINLPAIFRLGPTALGAMTVGALGIALGAVAAYALFWRWVPPETWKGIGALSASWIGGNANMLAVKEGLQTPDTVFAPMVIVDTVITYSWMGIMVALAPWQDAWDRWVHADRSTLDDVNRRIESAQLATGDRQLATNPCHALWLLGGALLIGALCIHVGRRLPSLGTALNAAGWAFMLVTVLGIGLSLTPVAKVESYGASRWGYICLYLLLAAIGSKARLQDIFQAPLLIVMAYTWVFFHALCLAVYGFFRNVPMFFLVTASQANIGGTASTPIVAGVYQAPLAPLGLLLAISGNVIGTYAGIAIAQACHWVAR